VKPSRNIQHIGGHSFHVGDCRVWAEINYLDSASNYSETLAEPLAQRSQPQTGTLVPADNAPRFSGIAATFIQSIWSDLRGLAARNWHRVQVGNHSE
jgi:hypothetical protein